METQKTFFEAQKPLAEVFGSLTKQKTTSARRRYGQENDEDMLLPFIDPYLIDCELKITRSKAHRRLHGKAQVITNPDNPHTFTRISHTGDVVAIASLISAILGLNVELTKAIALVHDIGHFPLGHPAERILRDIVNPPPKHEIFGVVIAQHIERNGKGLNLTHEVLLGMSQHSRGKEQLEITNGMTSEAAVVMIADKLAYLTRDFEDAEKMGLALPNRLTEIMLELGKTGKERINHLITDVCLESAERGRISFCKKPTSGILREARVLMYEQVYPMMDIHDVKKIIERIYEFLRRTVGNCISPVVAYALLTDQEIITLAYKPVLDV